MRKTLNYYDLRSDFNNLKGKVVSAVFGKPKGDELAFQLNDGSFQTWRADGDCCSTSWFEHISGLGALIGREVLKVEEISMGEISKEDQKDRDCLQNYGFRLTTDKGYFEVEMRNESNGYYGGSVMQGSSPGMNSLPELKEDF